MMKNHENSEKIFIKPGSKKMLRNLNQEGKNEPF